MNAQYLKWHMDWRHFTAISKQIIQCDEYFIKFYQCFPYWIKPK